MLGDLLFLASLAAWSALVGRRLLRLFGAAAEGPIDALALAVPLGLGALALGVLGLGLAGWLTTWGILGLLLWGILVAGSAGGISGLRDAFRGWRPRRPETPWGWLAAALGGATLLATLATALAPVTDGDALCYHLQVPKVFLEAGGFTYEPDLHETVYPLATESLYAVALALRGPVACRTISWLLGISFAASAWALARPSLGGRAYLAGLIALLAPAVSNGMSAPLNDVALAAFGNAAILAWARWWPAPSQRGAALAGLLAGIALGTKYPALVFAGLLGLAFAIRRPKHAAIFAAAALAAGGAWYARAWWHTGNPVHPFFRSFFGSGIDEVLDPSWRPLAVSPLPLLTALWPMTIAPDRFDSFSHQFGPIFLLLLPALAWERPPRRIVALALLGFAFLTLCLTQRQGTRFVLAALGPFAAASAWVASRLIDRASARDVPARAVLALLALVLAFECAIAVGRVRAGLPVLLGRESAESYLSRREPTYPLGCWIDEHLSPDARIIGQDHRGFYIPRPYAMEKAHRRRTGLGELGEAPEAIVEALRARGYTHLLMCPPVPEDAVEFDPALGRLLGGWLAQQTPIYREDLADADGIVRRYALYEIATEQPR